MKKNFLMQLKNSMNPQPNPQWHLNQWERRKGEAIQWSRLNSLKIIQMNKFLFQLHRLTNKLMAKYIFLNCSLPINLN
jgi:hypothetical protein